MSGRFHLRQRLSYVDGTGHRDGVRGPATKVHSKWRGVARSLLVMKKGHLTDKKGALFEAPLAENRTTR